MSVMLSLLSWFLLVMAAGGVLHTNSATAEVTIASNSAAVTAYWHTMLPNTLMPSAILELLAQPAGIIDHIGVQRTGKMKEAKYVGEPLLKARKMGLRSPEGKDQNLDGNWAWGSSVKAEEQSLDGSSTKGKDQNSDGNLPWGSSMTNDVHESNGNWAWGSSTKGKDPNLDGNWAWGSSTKGKDPNLDGNWAWGSSTKGKDPNLDGNWAWGSSTKGKDPNLDGNWAWGSSTKSKDPNLDGNWAWGSSTKGKDPNLDGNWAWGSATKGEDQNLDGNWAWGSTNHVHQSNGETNIGQDKHKHGIMSNRVFLEEALKPGSTIPCYIQPSANSGAPLLRHEVADSIPITTGNFSDILTIFAPVSNDMATNIWSTLDFCEHPRAIKGETKACVTSVESMVDFNAFVLGVSTYNLQAFSSPDVPVQGVMTGRGYKVAAVTRIREAGDTITCHGMKFPFAMFMCHAVNPTRVYSVTLEEDDVDVDGMGQRMEVLVVCHLDTSDFHPAKMPLHVKPGDAPLCHFLSRDSILWTPAAPASGHAAA